MCNYIVSASISVQVQRADVPEPSYGGKLLCMRVEGRAPICDGGMAEELVLKCVLSLREAAKMFNPTNWALQLGT
jgi:hypothetical protein